MKIILSRLAVIAHIFNSIIQETEAGGSLNSRPTWSTEQVPGQPGLYKGTLSRNNNFEGLES